MIGTTLSHYLIEAELGRGGMGIVYRAKDTTLERTVAIKVLPSAALATDDDRARFYREAKSAAALNHPNIAAVYQIGEAVPSDAPHGAQPSPFIAMEFIEGETLEARIKKGPLKLAEAVELAKQIADGLKAAHAKDIVHRDIKAANVMLDGEGRAKILDFGLALTSQSTKLTRMGSTLGTVAYMSPEQARGEEVDSRTDLWALGVVLYEMIAGVNPFGGDYEQAVVYSILNTDPEPLTALRTGVPMELERITNKALSKDAARRYQTAADLIADLSGLDVTSPSQTTIRKTIIGQNAGTERGEPTSWRKLGGVAVLVAVLLAVAFWLGKTTIEDPEPPQMLKIALSTGSVQVISRPAISENARYIAFLGRDSTTSKTGFYLKDLEEGTTRYLEGTESHYWAYFSPDNQRLALTDGRGSSIMTLPDGKLSKFTDYAVADWYSNEELFTQGFDATIITLDGSPTFKFTADSTQGHDIFSRPIRAGNSDKIWFVARNRVGNKSDLVLYDTGSDAYSIVQKGGTWNFFWMNSGHIMTGKGQSGMEAHVRPFDPITGQFTGPDFNLGFELDPVMVGHSKSGHLVRALGSASYRDVLQLAWMDLDSGESATLDVPPDWYLGNVLSPDGNRIISVKSDESFKALELTSTDLISGLTSDYGPLSSFQGPFWPEQSDEFFFVTNDEGGFTIRGRSTLRSDRESNHPLNGFKLGKLSVLDVSEDLSRILASQRLENNETEIVVLSVENGEVLHKSSALLPQLALSPDGRYYAMVVASPTGERLIVTQVDGNETYVLTEATDNISTPIWTGNGNEIFYLDYSTGSTESSVHRLNVGLQPTFSYKGVEVLGDIPGRARLQDVDQGRNRLLYSKSLGQKAAKPIYELEMILNMSEYFKQVAPPSD